MLLNQTYSIGGPPVKAQTWAGVTMVGELDALELCNATGHTLARGRRDTLRWWRCEARSVTLPHRELEESTLPAWGFPVVSHESTQAGAFTGNQPNA